MRSIEVSTEIFAKIWSHRLDGEENENAILKRLLGVDDKQLSSDRPTRQNKAGSSKVVWRDDVRQALNELGGEAALGKIYTQVRQIRRSEGRSLPVNLKSIVRRELETNSSDSHSYTEKHDWFRSVGGIGSGLWALRQDEALR